MTSDSTATSTSDLAAAFGCPREQSFIKRGPRERDSAEKEEAMQPLFSPDDSRTLPNDGASKIERRDAGLVEIVDGFGAEELAADLVMRAGLLFQQHNLAPGGGEAQGNHGAGGPAPDDQVVNAARRWRSLRLSPADA